MSEKEKQTLDEISKAVSGMTEAEKARFLGIAEGMSIMKDRARRIWRVMRNWQTRKPDKGGLRDG